MTFLELQDEVMDQLNLTSTDARNRIKRRLNSRYREATTGVNLTPTRRGTTTFAVTADNPVTTATGIAKLLTVTDPTLLQDTLRLVSLNDIRQANASGTVKGVPRMYAIVSHEADSVTLELYPTPDANNTLNADIQPGFTPMVDDADVPEIPEDFHDLLVDGVLYWELMKMEKTNPLAVEAHARFEKRLAELRYFMVKSAWKHTVPHDMGGFARYTGRVWPYTNLQ